MKGGKISKRGWWIIGIVIVLIVLAVLLFRPGVLLSPGGVDCGRADISPVNPDGSVGDGIVDIGDLALFGANWGKDCSLEDCNRADISPVNPDGSVGDGLVDIGDLALLGANWGACSAGIVRSANVIRSITDNGDGTISVDLAISGNVKALGIREDGALQISDHSASKSFEILEFKDNGNEFLIADSNSEIGGSLNYVASGSQSVDGTFFYVDSSGDVIEGVIGGEDTI